VDKINDNTVAEARAKKLYREADQRVRRLQERARLGDRSVWQELVEAHAERQRLYQEWADALGALVTPSPSQFL
jgi:hypothetical protein